ncbi:metalloregulator ArsR/SmtB family transcription factor [Myxococcota bacterium]|nr:metalloregulator ArsR/SmtB family transcription factor [Myxococcota bacterium]
MVASVPIHTPARLDGDPVDRVRAALAGAPDLDRLAELHRTLADPTRLRILFALCQEELCVGDLAALLHASPSAVSHQLRTLRQGRILRARRDGRRIYYRLDDEHVGALFRAGLAHVAHGDGDDAPRGARAGGEDT